jgi:hypothetical protein
VVDYFPDALAAVAEVSFKGNEQHNPGQPLHWNRDKSQDFADTIMRHLIERGTMDTDGLRHSAKLAWRALANLQVELERDLGLSLPRNAKSTETKNNDEQRSVGNVGAVGQVATIPSMYTDIGWTRIPSGTEVVGQPRSVSKPAAHQFPSSDCCTGSHCYSHGVCVGCGVAG